MLKTLLALGRDVAVYGASNVLGQLVGFILLPLYTRYLDPAEYGVLAMLTIASAVFGGLASFGLPKGLLRYVIGNEDPGDRARLAGTCLSVVGLAALVLAALAAVVAEPLSSLLTGAAEHADLVRLTALQAGLATVGAVPVSVLRAGRRVGAVAAVNVGRVVVQASASIVAVVVFELGVAGVVLGGLCGELLSAFAASVVTFRSQPFRLDQTALRRMASYGLPMVPHELQATALAVFGQYVVRDLMGLSEAGLYGIAVRFAAPMTLLVSATQRAWAPFKLEVHARDAAPARTLGSLVTYFFAIVTGFWVGVSAWGPPLVTWVVDERFTDAGPLVPFAALVPLGLALYLVAGTGFEITKDTRPAPLISFAGLVVVIAGTYALVPPFGAAGAAVATALGWLAMSGAVYFLARSRFRVVYDWAGLAALAAVGCVCATGPSLFDAGPPAVRAALSTVAYPLLALAVLGRSRDERERIRRALTRVRAKFRRQSGVADGGRA